MRFGNGTAAVASTLTLIGFSGTVFAQTRIDVNVVTARHPISPNVYGAAFPTAAQIADLNMPLCRYGGNQSSSYNWLLNCDNRANDWFFETFADTSPVAGERGDTFIANAKSKNAQAMITIPMLNYLGKVGTNRSSLRSFSIAKYGPQTNNDPWQADAGNGVSTASGNPFIIGNDPTDANTPNSPAMQNSWVQHLISKWGFSNTGGLKYYILDNEPSLWNSTHRDVHPIGETYDELYNDYTTYGLNIRNADPNAVIFGPEEWGWSGYFYSGYDAAAGAASNWTNFPDRAAHGNMDHIPWLLQQLKAYETTNGKRLIDVLSVHYYPQQGEFSDDDSSGMQAIRNRSTRSLWDPNYTDTSWIGSKVQLIPRLKNWVSTYYPGLKTALTEYNWGDEGNMNGATTQADIFGILGREGLDFASRWTTPATGSPTYLGMKIFRNYDGLNSTFGDVSVACSAPNPDNLSAFAAQRSSDGAITILVINKVNSAGQVSLHIAGLPPKGPASVYQFSAASPSSIRRLTSLDTTGGIVSGTVPAQSVTLYVVPAARLSLTITDPQPVQATPNGTATYPAVALEPADPSAPVTGSIHTGPSWAHYDGQTLTVSPPANALIGNYPVMLLASEGGSSPSTATLSIMVRVGPALLQSAAFETPTVASGATDTLTVKLSSPAPHGGSTITVVNKDGLLTVPNSVTIPEGSQWVSLSVTAGAVTKNTNSFLTVSYGGKLIPATVRITPAR